MTAINVEIPTTERSMKKASQLAHAISKWVETNKKDKIIVGYTKDTISKKIAEAMVKVFGAFQIRTNLATQPASEEGLTKGIVMTKSCLGILVNHKNKEVIQIKSSSGQPLSPLENRAIRAMMNDTKTIDTPDLDEMMDEGLLNYIDMKILQRLANKM